MIPLRVLYAMAPVTAGAALLVTGLLAAKSAVIAQIACELDALALTRATCADSIARRLRRTLNDPTRLGAAMASPSSLTP